MVLDTCLEPVRPDSLHCWSTSTAIRCLFQHGVQWRSSQGASMEGLRLCSGMRMLLQLRLLWKAACMKAGCKWVGPCADGPCVTGILLGGPSRSAPSQGVAKLTPNGCTLLTRALQPMHGMLLLHMLELAVQALAVTCAGPTPHWVGTTGGAGGQAPSPAHAQRPAGLQAVCGRQ